MPVLLNELNEAQKELTEAQQQLDMAEGDFVEAAIFKVQAAEQRYNALLRLAKKEGVVLARRQIKVFGRRRD